MGKCCQSGVSQARNGVPSDSQLGAHIWYHLFFVYDMKLLVFSFGKMISMNRLFKFQELFF